MRLSLRQAAALLLTAAFLYICGALLPFLLRNLRLQRYVEDLTRRESAATQTLEALRTQVVERARQLDLPVQAHQVLVERAGPAVRIRVRYVVPVRLPGYEVKLHFAPSAGG